MVYTNLKAKENGLHGIWESSQLLSTDVGNIYDVIVRDEDAANKEIEVDNGVALAVLGYTGNGLEERYGRIAKVTDKIAVTGAPANVKTALTTEQGQAYNFTNPAGKPVKTYQIADPSVHTDIFGIASYQFTDDTAVKVKVGNLVTVDGKGAWVASEATELETLKGTNGFVGKIHSLSVGTYYTIVRIQVLQNKDIEG
ncbi:hypothetical protein [uncultured Eubacterium sp.]|uniref:hypothetical protein n=1 Tax=uncultured Eubacterium sp. TaxID=165185 RepID=UPI0025995153|nr:hypothetical protein [uncultured Eubacterium sp.]